ncbi:bifunctional methyltransferase/pyrophosphohydrolase YabN [Domibacillus epiphyticus]|uniref:Nucleoside triphosphate pyrophosphohydrolase n=1 Tax=Domibacillus epiphyticus TaxID=1714355 RepID=A0A1V2A7K0_9BACI|nr:nucleoside triphosphate pyrophosphohydrolase [Domibacillus epiphyticus]OMP66832.1 nucleoside triphosphate pyrophosphohydrolase [Domibacillus epiphyticus]
MTRKITIVGLGAADLEQMPLGVYRLLKESNTVWLRTKEHPVVSVLQSEGVHFESFDDVYERHDRFEDVYDEIVEQLIEKSAVEPILYAVPGHPMAAEKTVQLLLERKRTGEVDVVIAGGHSFLDALFASIEIDPADGFQLLDGTALHRDHIHIFGHVIIAQVYDSFVASDVKLTLMEKYPDEHEVTIVTAAGSENEVQKTVPLYELDHAVSLNNLTSVYVPPIKKEEDTYREFSVVRSIIARLRDPDGGCPWDLKQTHSSLKKYLIEETYELFETIDEEDDDAMVGELGDVLLQVLLHAQIGEDEGMFTIEDVIQSISSKMVRRHPHVFGDASAETIDDVKANWQAIKAEEKGNIQERWLDGISKGLPALISAYEIQKKAAKAGFDWDSAAGAIEKVKEEWAEFLAETEAGDASRMNEEFGDLLFSLINVARFYDIHPEESLTSVNSKFRRRFEFIEDRVIESGRPYSAYTLDELDSLWNEAKKEERRT